MQPVSTSSPPLIQWSRQVVALAAEYNLLAYGELGLRQRPRSDSLADPARNLLFHPTPVQQRQPFNRRFFLKSPRAFAKISKRKEEITKRDRERVLWSKADRQGGLPCPGRISDDRSASRLWNHASCCRAASPHPQSKSNTCSN